MNVDFSPEKSLFSLPIVRWCAGFFAFISSLAFISIAINMRNVAFDLSGAGFNYFADCYKVPATFLAIGFTLVGLCAANHRSEQTKKQIERTASQIELTNSQIELTKSQNNFSNHYKHIDEFEKYLKENGNLKLMNIAFSRALHSEIFKNSRNGNYDLDNNYILSLQTFLQSILNLSDGLKHNDEWLGAIYKISEQMSLYLRNAKLYDGGVISYVEKRRNGAYVANYDWNMKIFINQVISIAKGVDTILKFDPKYKSPEIVISFIEMDTNLLPSEDLGGGNFYPINLRRIVYDRENDEPTLDYTTNPITTSTQQ